MKFGSLCCLGLILSGACVADDVVEPQEEKVSSIDKCSGFYAGVGISRQQWKNTWNLSDNYGEAFRQYCVRNNVVPNANFTDKHDYNFGNGDGSKIGGFLTIGYATSFSNELFGGIAITADIAGSKSYKQSNKINANSDFKQTTAETKGTTFTIAGELGSLIKPMDLLVLLRLGVCLSNNKLKSEYFNKEFTNKNCSPIAGIVFRKNLVCGLDCYFGFDYRFSSKKTWDNLSKTGALHGYSAKLKNDSRGFVVRVGVVHKF